MGSRLAGIGLSIAFGLLAPSDALAQQTRILICGDQPNPPSGYQIQLDYANSQVQIFGQWHPAQLSEQTIQWRTPRYEPGTGEVRLGRRYYLDRIQGTLRGDPECLQRDWEFCHVITSYCRVGQGLF
jgi:hypothetical protein